MKAIDTFSFLA